MNIYLGKELESKLKSLKNTDGYFNVSELCRAAIEKRLSGNKDKDLRELLGEIQINFDGIREDIREKSKPLEELQDYVNALDEMERTKTSVPDNETMLESTDDKKVEKPVELDI